MTYKISKLLLLFGCLTLFSFQNNGIIVKDLTQSTIPESISFKGKLIEAKKWTDKNGDNYLIISRFGPSRTPDPDSLHSGFTNVDLNACQYLIKNNSAVTLWKTSESVKNCMTDMWIELFPNSTSITDLNKNGITETTIVYRYSCRGDISPSNMKVVMHEGTQTFCLNGIMYMEYEIGKLNKTSFEFNSQKVSSEESKKYTKHPFALNFGRYSDETDFKDSSREFLLFARNKWIEFCDKDSFKQFGPADYQESIPDYKKKP
jgi:hypothetical protein